MIEVTKSNVRDFYYDTDRDDYFYKDDGERVPDRLRKGFQTTIFKCSSYNPLAHHASNDELEKMMEELNIKVH
jgi:hypothetical protein